MYQGEYCKACDATEYCKACDTGAQMVSCYPRPVFSRTTPTAEREDFHLNNACHDPNIPEVTLLIMIKHLTGSKRLGV